VTIQRDRFVATALHPQAQALVDAGVRAGAQPVNELTLEQARARAVAIGDSLPAPPEVKDVQEIVIATERRDIAARLYRPRPQSETPLGTVIQLHGGGWATGTLDMVEPLSRVIALASHCDVLSVEYALAPEAPFPQALLDARAALDWAAEHGEGRPIAVVGDSAGANLAAALALQVRDEGGPEITCQVLAYPITDGAMATPSYSQHGFGPATFTAGSMRWYFDRYVPEGVDRLQPAISPLRAESHHGLPPTHLIVAEHDPLRDDGLLYAEALDAAGVPVDVDFHGDMLHGFCMYVGVLDAAEQALVQAGLAIRRAMQRTAATTPQGTAQ
jgi:acetyl esterase